MGARRSDPLRLLRAFRELTVLCWHLIIRGEDYAYAQPCSGLG
jgi:hypothetical protein